jgi:predicted nucleic acid-binding protein
MRIVFADTFYLVALLNPKDQWHRRAIEVKDEI